MGGGRAAPQIFDLQHLPNPLLSCIFQQLDLHSRPAWTSTCRALRIAALHALGRSMVSRALARPHSGQGRFEVAPAHFLATLTMLHELVVELDASAPGVAAEEVLEALAAMLACLPHCRWGSAAPRLQLCLRVALAPGARLPGLEAFQLQHLLHDVGLLPHGLESVQIDAPCFSLDGGLDGVLSSARLTAEQHLLEGLATTAAYARLRSLALDFGSPLALEGFGELVHQGQFPSVQRLKLARQYASDPPPQAWDPVELDCRAAVLEGVSRAREAAFAAGRYASSDEDERPPSPLDCAGPVPTPLELRRLGLLQPSRTCTCQLCSQPWEGCCCAETYERLAAEYDPCYNGADLSFLRRLAHLTCLELANFSYASPGSAAALPALPRLQSLALTYEPWFRRQPGFREANAGGDLTAVLAERMPALRSLHLERVCSDEGISTLKGLTSLIIDQGCEAGQFEGYRGFSWEICRLRRLEELQLRGGWGWMVRHASWRGLLQPKSFAFSGLGRLRRFVFDVRGWAQAPDQTGLEPFLETVLDCFVNSNDSLQSLVSIHAVLENGAYSPSKNDGYLAQEGPLGAWGAVRDEYGEMWVAVLCAEQTPKVILMHQLATADTSDSAGGEGEGEDGWSSDGTE